ncbi:Cytoplasmic dynein 2 light intermediate chain 1 [Amphibalanus amphitrite]|uniref:Cytoplasmic dynein 2 light intermediate chain 1 n=1 Tax=Amphibalanus amphitrite TaxID=1232801 RepID=A0A6A4X1A1_AMPAM|nr:Cytoplasmic dynein 2 light intermediate chain 1 [Amphibalanus amphitrite]
MPEEETKEKTPEKSSSDKEKEGDNAKEKKPEPAKDTSNAKPEPSKGRDSQASAKDKPSSSSAAKEGEDKNKDGAKQDPKQKSDTAKPAEKTSEPGKSGSKQAIKSPSAAKTSSSEQKPRKPSIAVSSTDPGSDSLVKSAMQKARRASIRAKGRGSSVSQSLLGQKTSRLISTVDIASTLEADNVWDLAVKLKQVSTELSDPDEGQRETTLIVLGGKQSGKTTLVGQLLGSEEAARRTLGLDYTYARRAGRGIGRDVCQIWELGGGTAFLQLLDTPVRAERLSDTACVIVVDLTRPETILPTVEAITKYLAELIDKKLKEAGTTGVLVRNLLNSQLNARLPADHPDAKAVKPLLIPLALVGGMYDKFQPMDTTEKKVVAEAMRWAAHRHFATLLYFSSKEVALQGRAKDLLTHLAFGEEANPRQSLDVQKPLQIAAGSDTFRAIGGGGDGSLPYDVVLSHVSAKWPPRPEATGVPDDPAKDALFAEPEVDSLRAEKVKELDRLRQDLERRRKMALERAAAEKAKSKAPAAVSKQAAQQAAAEFLERHHSSMGEGKKEEKAATKPEAKKPEAKADSKPVAKSDGKDGGKAAAKPAAKDEAKTAAKTDTKPDAKPAAKAEEKKETKSETKPEGKAPAGKADPKADAKADPKPAAKSEAKSDSKPDAKPDAKPATKAEPKTEAKPTPKPEQKSDAKPTAKK